MRRVLLFASVGLLGCLASPTLSGTAGAAIHHRAVHRSAAIGAKKSPVQVVPITGLGGYYSPPVNVDSIAAQWHVPTVAPSSPAGIALTWIGAQNGNATTFIQLGTTERAFGRGIAAGYEVFWSDYSVGDNPRYFGRVAGGDVLAASMQRVASGWQLLVRDETSGSVFAKTVAYDPRGNYNQGEWLQEDPAVEISTLVAARDISYPRTSRVGFEDVTVNGAVPDLRFADGQALSATGGVFLVPTRFTDDSFQMLPATGFTRRYLLDAAAFNSVEDAFAVESLTWASDKVETRVADVQRLITAYHRFDEAIERESWPVATRPAMLGLVRADAAD
ncbi:MAG: hypothetical protein WCF24_12440, partial [Acidimicrobiales bacterium]